jgi:antitoxin (DNA-binding transcriptional repressor) of toxin-antitoxin stability system
MTKMVSMAAAKASLSELASRASAGDRFMLLRRGKPIAAIVGPQDLAALESGSATAGFLESLAAFRRRYGPRLPASPLRVRRSRGRSVK